MPYYFVVTTQDPAARKAVGAVIAMLGGGGIVFSLAIFALALISEWKIYEKLGHEGWEGIAPFYNTYVLFDDLYENGWRFLTLLVPFYGIYVAFVSMIDLAKLFGRSSGFGVGLTLLPVVFYPILAFSKDKD